MSKKGFLHSSIGKKFVMGLTGLFLISFLVIHVSLNSAIFLNDNGATFNAGAEFMAHNPVIRVLEIGLFAGLILHIFQALMLTLENRKARPIAYARVNGAANSKWYSRSMGILGSLLLIFLVVQHFWFRWLYIQRHMLRVRLQLKWQCLRHKLCDLSISHVDNRHCPWLVNHHESKTWCESFPMHKLWA